VVSDAFTERLVHGNARAQALAETFPGQRLVVDATTGEKFFTGTRLN
jgi:hypothetical protein